MLATAAGTIGKVVFGLQTDCRGDAEMVHLRLLASMHVLWISSAPSSSEAPLIAMHLPLCFATSRDQLPLARRFQVWLGLPVQVDCWIAAPNAVDAPATSRHRPLSSETIWWPPVTVPSVHCSAGW